jgi:hypothetical protein
LAGEDMRKFDSGWKKAYKELDNIDLGYFKKHPVIKKTMNKKFYKHQKNILFDKVSFFDGFSILEIGGGFGGLYKLIADGNPALLKYTLVDHPNMLHIAKFYLGEENKRFVDAGKINIISDNKYDLFISVHCLSEIPVKYREKIYMTCFPICNKAFIIDGSKDSKFRESLLKYLNDYFNNVEETKYPDYKNTKLYYAVKQI